MPSIAGREGSTRGISNEVDGIALGESESLVADAKLEPTGGNGDVLGRARRMGFGQLHASCRQPKLVKFDLAWFVHRGECAGTERPVRRCQRLRMDPLEQHRRRAFVVIADQCRKRDVERPRHLPQHLDGGCAPGEFDLPEHRAADPRGALDARERGRDVRAGA